MKQTSLIKPKLLLTNTLWLYEMLISLTVLINTAGLYLALVNAPTDYQQGENYRLIYVHLPTAWICLSLYIMLALLSFLYILQRYPLLITLAKTTADLGVLFTSLTLITGSLWGAKTWGTFWIWDARLTSVLILLFLFLAYLSLLHMLADHGIGTGTKKAATNNEVAASMLALIGVINIPIIKYSVNYFNTLHQPASITTYGSSIDVLMLVPILLMVLGFTGYVILMYILYVRTAILKTKTKVLTAKEN